MDADIVSEQWRPVIGFEGLYEISDLGSIRSVPRRSRNNVRLGGYLKGEILSRIPYMRVTLFKDGVRHRSSIHRLVYEAFRGPIPRGMCVCHNDGDPGNNQIYNLRLDTQSGNLADRNDHGTNIVGERNGRAKVTEDQVREMHRRHAAGETIYRIAKDYPIDRTGVNGIILGYTWKHIYREFHEP